MAKGGKGHALRNVGIALAVGAAAVAVTSYAAPKIPQLMQYPWLTPVVMIGAGLLLAKRGRTASGIGLAGAGGALGFLLYGPRIMGSFGTQPSANQPPAAGAFASMPSGYPDAGSMQGRDSGWYDRPAAGGLYGPATKYGASNGTAGTLYEAMGTPGDAGNIPQSAEGLPRDA